MNGMKDAIQALHNRGILVPDWLVSLVSVSVVCLAAWWLHGIVFKAVTDAVRNQTLFRRSLVSRTQAASRLLFIVVGVALAVPAVPLPTDQADVFNHLITISVIVLIGWCLHIALYIWMTLYLRRFKLDSEDNLLARKHATQSRILNRVANT